MVYTAVVLRILRCDWLLVNQTAGSNPDKGSGGSTAVLASGQALTINTTVSTKQAFLMFGLPIKLPLFYDTYLKQYWDFIYLSTPFYKLQISSTVLLEDYSKH